MSTPWYSAVQDGSRIQEHIALRLFIFFEPYLVEQECMANAQLLMYGSKHLEQNFFFFVFLKKCEYPMVLSDLEIPPDPKIHAYVARESCDLLERFSYRGCKSK